MKPVPVATPPIPQNRRFKSVIFTLPKELDAALDVYCKRTKLTRSSVVRMAVQTLLKI